MIVYKGMREDMTCTQGRGKFQYHLGETIREDRAEANCAGAIAIARGEQPMVKGAAGAFLGMIKETGGLIEEARLVEVKGEIRPDTWYTLHENRPKEVER